MLTFVTAGWAQMDAAAKLKPMIEAYAQIWNTGNLSALDALIDPSFVRHTSPGNPYSAANLDSLKHQYHARQKRQVYGRMGRVGRHGDGAAIGLHGDATGEIKK